MNENNPIKKAGDLSGIPVDKIMEEIGIDADTVRELDKDPLALSAYMMMELEKFTGVAADRLLPRKKITGPRLEPVYEEETEDLVQLIEQKRESCAGLQEKYADRNDEEISGILREIRDSYENTAKTTMENIRKPMVSVFGNSDSGKSTLINYLLGEKVAETDYTPLTSEVVYYHHISDMPEHLKSESGNHAFVFGEKNKKRASRTRGNKFSHDDINDPEKAEKYLIYAGNLKEVIEKYSSRAGSNYQNREYTVFEIVAYLDNDVLRELTFIDIPGFGSGDKNDDIGLVQKMYAVDILFYLMPANAFMRETDIINLRDMIKRRGRLSGLYILATQANNIGSPVDNKKILDSGHERFVRLLSKKQAERTDIDYSEEFRRCFYSFDIDNEKYCKALNDSLRVKMPELIRNKVRTAKEQLSEACRVLNDQYKTEREHILNSRPSEKKSKEAERAFLSERKTELRIQRAELKNEIEEYRKSSQKEFEEFYDLLMNEKTLVQLMEKINLQNKKEDVSGFCACVCEQLGDHLSEGLGDKGKKLTEKINRFMEEYEESWNVGKKAGKISIDFSGFDFERAFAAGLTGVGAYGALAVWSAVVAGGSNLGGYILVSKVVSVLSSIGISLGGTSAVASAVAAIGGPVTIGLALAGIAAIGAFGFLSGSWKKRLAKNIISKYETGRVKERYIEEIDKYWNDTLIALDQCLDSLEERLLDYYHRTDIIQDRIGGDDQELFEEISYIFYTVCNLYGDLQFKLSVDKKRIGSDYFLDRKNEIEADLDKIRKENTKYKFRSDIHEMEGLVFLDAYELQEFWRDLRDILNDRAAPLISLTDDMFILKREGRYSVYYKKSMGQISIRYVDTYPYAKADYEKYKDLIINTYLLRDDQIRYKIFDMISMAKKELLIIMPWINRYGWESTGNYGKSLKQLFEEALSANGQLSVRILAGYDLLHPDRIREKQTVEMSEQISREFNAYSERFKIYTGIGSHEKIITMDNVCSLAGSYNLLSNDAPYQEKVWAGESMNIFENPYNIERHRREIMERANLEYMRYM